MQSSPEPNIRIKGQKLDMRGSTVNLSDAEGESNTFTSCEFHLFVCELCNCNSFELPTGVSCYDEGVNCQFKEFQELLIFNSAVHTLQKSKVR